MNLYKVIFFLTLIIIFSNCTKVFNQINNLTEEERIVIDAFINDVTLPPLNYYTVQEYLDPYELGIDPPKAQIISTTAKEASLWELYDSYVKIRKSKSLFTTVQDDTVLITNATVILQSDDGQVDTLREVNDPKFIAHNRYNPKGFFRLQNMHPQAGKTYTLTVKYQNKIYQAVSFMPKLKSIDSMKVIFHTYNNKAIDYINNTYKEDAIQPVVYVNKNEPNGYFLCKLPHQYYEYNDSLYYRGARSFDWYTNVVDENKTNTDYIDGYYVNSAGGVTQKNLYLTGNTLIPNNSDYSSTVLNEKGSLFYMYDKLFLQKLYYKYNLSFGLVRIYFGSLSKESYDYFYELNKLYKSDAGIYTPTPNSPYSNFSNGALGYFYTSSAQVYDLFIPIVSLKYTMDGAGDNVLPLVTISPLGAHYFRKEYMLFDNKYNIDTTVTFPNRRPF